LILLTRRLALDVRAVFRRALCLSSRGGLPPVHLEAGPDGLWIRCRDQDCAVEYHHPGEQSAANCWIPFAMLADVEGRRDEPVRIEPQKGSVSATWQNGPVPCVVRHDMTEPTSKKAFPPVPETWAENEPRLVGALAAAMETTDPNSARYALGCVQLRGEQGTVAATDGRQLLLESGFTFPWTEDLLLRGTSVFRSRELPEASPVQVGKRDKWIVVRIGPWTFWSEANTEGRFPDIERHVPDARAAAASLEIHQADAQFLVEHLPHLPGGASFNEPVTLELNGRAVVRARSADFSKPTEVILARSACSGQSLRLNTNRRYLARALALGFGEVHITDPKSPVLSLDAHRRYVWAPLDPGSALVSTEDAVQIDSRDGRTGHRRKTHSRNLGRKERNPMPSVPSDSPSPDPKGRNGSAASASTSPAGNGRPKRPAGETDSSGRSHPRELSELIGQAEAVRASLRETLSQTASLLVALKRHSKKSKAVTAALASLRELQPTH